MTLPFDLQHVTLDTEGIETLDPARCDQIAALMLRLGSFLGHFPTARAHVQIWNDLVEDTLHLQVEIVIADEELGA